MELMNCAEQKLDFQIKTKYDRTFDTYIFFTNAASLCEYDTYAYVHVCPYNRLVYYNEKQCNSIIVVAIIHTAGAYMPT